MVNQNYNEKIIKDYNNNKNGYHHNIHVIFGHFIQEKEENVFEIGKCAETERFHLRFGTWKILQRKHQKQGKITR